MPLTGGRPVWRRAKATHTERESRTYTYRSLGYVDVVELTAVCEAKSTGMSSDGETSAQAGDFSEEGSSEVALNYDSSGTSSQKEQTIPEILRHDPEVSQRVQTPAVENESPEASKPLCESPKDVNEQRAAKHESEQVPNAEIEHTKEVLVGACWPGLELGKYKALPGMTSSKASNKESQVMNSQPTADHDTASQPTDTDDSASEPDENVPASSRIHSKNRKKLKHKRKRAYGSAQVLTWDYQARQALNAALEDGTDSARPQHPRGHWKPWENLSGPQPGAEGTGRDWGAGVRDDAGEGFRVTRW